jgi:hypothetical protein
MTAGMAVTQAPILFPFDSVQAIEDPFRALGLYHIFLVVRLLVHVGIKTENLEL